VGQLLNMVLSVMLFLSPIFFPVDVLPKSIQPWLFLNPLALTITQTREVLLDGLWPQWQPLAIQMMVCCAIAAGGAAFFHSARKGFADVV
jgi:lipopolysaccharide transport system permease protein